MKVKGPLHAPAALPPARTQHTMNKNIVCHKQEQNHPNTAYLCIHMHVHLYACMVAHIHFGYTDTNLVHEEHI
jgi:peroxiredoxin family protein